MKCSLGISNFLQENVDFLILLFSSIFLHWSLRKAFLSLFAILWNSIQMGLSFLFFFAFTSLLFTAICKASSDNHFAFCISFSWEWSWSLSPVQCHEPVYIVLQALCLSDIIPWIYNHKGFDLGHTWMVQRFPYFLQFKSEFGNKVLHNYINFKLTYILELDRWAQWLNTRSGLDCLEALWLI